LPTAAKRELRLNKLKLAKLIVQLAATNTLINKITPTPGSELAQGIKIKFVITPLPIGPI